MTNNCTICFYDRVKPLVDMPTTSQERLQPFSNLVLAPTDDLFGIATATSALATLALSLQESEYFVRSIMNQFLAAIAGRTRTAALVLIAITPAMSKNTFSR